ncbi:MAG: GEVED domain-containing protein [Gallionella sp.]|nr:GEVED domain-containing protein [Gallionella sp.]
MRNPAIPTARYSKLNWQLIVVGLFMLIASGAANSAEPVKGFTPNLIDSGVVTTLNIGFVNNSGAPLTGAQMIDNLPSNATGRIIVATPPNIRNNTCGNGTTTGVVTAAAGGASIAISNATLPATSNGLPGCSFDIDVVGQSSTNQGLVNTVLAGALTFNPINPSQDSLTSINQSLTINAVTSPSVALSLSPKSTVLVGEQTNLIIDLTNNSFAANLTNTQWAMDLPTNITIAAAPTIVSGCGAGSAVSGTVGAAHISFTNGTVLLNGGVCKISVPIVGSAPGTYSNIILPANAITNTQFTTKNTDSIAPSLAVQTISATKQFTSNAGAPITTIQAGVPFRVEVTVTNTGNVTYTGLSITDKFQADGNTLTTLKLTNAASPVYTATGCGAGHSLAQFGANAGFTFSGGTLDPAIFPAQTTCVVSVEVYSTATFASKSNSIPTTNIATTAPAVVNPYTALTANIAATAFVLGTNANVVKSFATSPIAAGATGTFTITVNNTSVADFAALAINDTLPTNMTVNSVGANTCGTTGGTPIAGATAIALTGGTLAAGASCSVTFTVNAPNLTGSQVTYSNTATVNFTHLGIAETGLSSNTAQLKVDPLNVTTTKTFSPVGPITAGDGQTPTLDIAITNSSVAALSALSINDPMPNGMNVASFVSNNCGTSTNPAVGNTTIALTGGSLAAGATCHVFVTVNAPNTTAAAQVDANTATIGFNYYAGQTTPTSITAAKSITVNALTVLPTKNFGAATINAGDITTLVFTIPNTSAVDFTSVSLTDALPTGMVVDSFVSSVGCGALTNPVAGNTTISLTGGTVLAAASCVVTVNVNALNTTAALKNFNNAGATVSVKHSGQATAQTFTIPSKTLAVNAIAVVPTKNFTTPVVAGQTSTMTISVPNTTTLALTNLTISDTFPAGMKVVSYGSTSAGCGALANPPAVNATSISMTGGSVAVGQTCTITLTVTAPNTGSTSLNYANTATTTFKNYAAQTTAYSLTAANTLVVNPITFTLTKAFSQPLIAVGATVQMSLTLNNTSAANFSNLAITDPSGGGALLGGMTVQSVDSNTCNTTGGTPVVGATTIAMTGGTLAAGASCTVTFTVLAPTSGSYTNIAKAVFDVPGQVGIFGTAQDVLVVDDLTATKAFGGGVNPTITIGGTDTITITIYNWSTTTTKTAIAFTDTLGAAKGLIVSAAGANATNTCGGTFAPVASATSVTLSGGSLPVAPAAGTPSSCTLTFDVDGVATAGCYNNTIHVTATGSSTLIDPSPAYCVQALTGGYFNYTSKSFVPNTVLPNAISTASINWRYLQNGGAATRANSKIIDTLPLGLTVASPANAVVKCGGTTLTTAGTGTTTRLLANPVVSTVNAANDTITFDVLNVRASTGPTNNNCVATFDVTGSALGAYNNVLVPTDLTTTTASTNGAINTVIGTLNIVANLNITPVTKTFLPTTILTGGTSTVSVGWTNAAPAGTAAMTNVDMVDNLPANVSVAAVPNASYSCTTPTVNSTPVTPTVSALRDKITISLPTFATGQTCTAKFDVTSNVVGAWNNTIAIGDIASATTPAFRNSTASPTRTLTVVDTINLTVGTKTFAPATIIVNGISTVSVPWTNNGPTGSVAVTNIDFTDTLPANITVAAVPNASYNCGTLTSVTPTVSALRDQITIHVPSQAQGVTCTVKFDVTSATAGSGANWNNTIPVGGIISADNPLFKNYTASNAAALTVVSTINFSAVTKSAFSPSTIVPGFPSKVTVSWKNAAIAGTPAINNVQVTDNLPAGMRLATTPNASYSCTTPTVTSTPITPTVVGQQVQLLIPSQAAQQTCTVVFDATSDTVGSYSNRIQIGDITSLDNAGYTNSTASAAVSLTVNTTNGFNAVRKTFTPATITAGGISQVAVRWTNNSTAGSIAVPNVDFTDGLPANVTVATTPNASYSCTTPTVNSTAVTPTVSSGRDVITIRVPSMAQGQTCTVLFDVTSTLGGTWNNQIPVGNIVSADYPNFQNTVVSSPTGGAPLNPTPLTVTSNIGVSKIFSEHNLGNGAVTKLTIELTNPESQNLTGVSFTDTLPGAVVPQLLIAPTPNATTSCGSGTVTAVAGSRTVSLANGTIPMLFGGVVGRCTVTVDVIANFGATASGTLTNTIGIGTVNSTGPARTNSVAATDSVTIVSPTIITAKEFIPNSVLGRAATKLTVHIQNPQTYMQTNITFTDDMTNAGNGGLPANSILISSTPNATSTCGTSADWSFTKVGGGALTGGESAFHFSGGKVPARVGAVSGTCDVTIDVIPQLEGSYSNIIPTNALTTDNGATNPTNVTGSVTSVAGVSVIKAFSPNPSLVGQTLRLLITLGNSSLTTDFHSATVRDTLPVGLKIASTPNLTNGCGGTLTLNSATSPNYIDLTGGAITRSNNCVIGVDIVADTGCNYPNTIAVNALSVTDPSNNVYHNQQAGMDTAVVKASLKIIKLFNPSNDPGVFTFSVTPTADVTGASTLVVDKNTNFATVIPFSVNGGKTYTITETGNNPTVTSDYTTTYSCSNGDGTVLTTGTGTTFTVNQPASCGAATPNQQSIVCTVTNVNNVTGSVADHGDAPAAFGDAAHTVPTTPTVYLGNVIPDTDSVSSVATWQAQTTATGDEGAGTADEGIAQLLSSGSSSFPVLSTSPGNYSLTLRCAGTTTANAVSGWIDFNRNNVFDAGERAQGTCSAVSNGTVTLTWTTFTGINVGATYARFRIASIASESSNVASQAADGEVEDYKLTIAQGVSVTVTKVSNGGTGTFTFTGTNGWANQNIATVTSGSGVAGAAQSLAAAGMTTDIVETPVAGYTVTAINCIGLGAGGAASYDLPNRKVTLNAAATAAGSNISCTFTNTFTTGSTVTVTKISNGGTGTFTFTGTNGWTNQNISTVTSGVGVSGAAQTLTTPGAATDIIESVPPAGYSLTAISCTGLGSGTATVDLLNRKVTLDGLATTAGNTVICTFTNTLSGAATLTLRKQWLGAVVNDAVSVTATGLTSLSSVANTSNKLDSGTSQAVSAGNVITIGETYAVGSAANYTSFLACTGTTGLSGNVLTVGASDAAIVCTLTNTYSHGITGTVFKDNGVGGGIANNGIQDGGETGIAGVTITANQAGCAGTVCGTALTDSSGNYVLLLPSSVAGAITLTETNLSGMLSTGGSAGSSGGTYTRSTDTTAFTVVSGASYTGLNFGDVPENQFTTDGVQAAMPGTVVFYPHRFIAGTAENVSFVLSSVASPAVIGWSEVLYVDANCNATIDAGEVIAPTPMALTAGQEVCLLVKEFVPASGAMNAQNAVTITANVSATFSGAAVSFSYVHHDTTTVGQPTSAGLVLVKSVDKTTAMPGDMITYTIAYTNNGSGILSNVVINDATPAYTLFQSADCGVLPLNFVLPCNITKPAVGSTGSIIYNFTGTLVPTSSGAVHFTVQVQP